MDPLNVRRPGSDEGFRDLSRQIQSLNQRVNELAATIGSQGVTYAKNTLYVPGNAVFAGTLEIAGGLIGAEALDSQIQAGVVTATNTAWQPGTAWGNAASITLTRPPWATSVIAIAGGHINPNYNPNAGSPFVYGRISAPTGTSPIFMSIQASSAMPMGLVWPFLIESPAPSFTISTQAYAASGVTLAGGSASVTAVALWLR